MNHCLLLNARSLKNKLHEFNSLLNDEYLVVSVTESWLNSSVTNSMIDASGNYIIYRNDRTIGLGGGVLCLVSAVRPSFIIPIPDKFRHLDVIAVSIQTENGTLRYITVYRAPEFNKFGRENMNLLIECLDYLCDTRDTIVMVGDFNLPYIDWTSLSCPDDGIHSVFLQFCIQYGLYQFVDVPTRENHLLDLVLSSDHIIISELKVASPFSTSDHATVDFGLIVAEHGGCSNVPSVFYDYDNADFDSIAHYLLNDSF